MPHALWGAKPSHARSALISQTAYQVVIKVPSETQKGRGTRAVSLGLSLLICKMARLDRGCLHSFSATWCAWD